MPSEIRESQSEYNTGADIGVTPGAPYYWSYHSFWKRIEILDNTEYKSSKVYAVALYHALLNYADKYGKCFPSQDSLAKQIGCSRPTLKRATEALRLAGLIDTDNQDGMKKSYTYFVHRVPDASDISITDANHVSNDAKEVRITDAKEVRTNKNHSLTRTNNYRGEKKAELIRWFDELWKRYPHYGGMTGGRSNRKESEKVFLQLNPSVEDVKHIAHALEIAKKSKKWTDDGGQFVESMQKWLRSEPWKNIPLGEEVQEKVIRRGNYTFYPATGDIVDKFGRKMKGELQPSGVIKTSSGTFIDLEGKEKS